MPCIKGELRIAPPRCVYKVAHYHIVGPAERELGEIAGRVDKHRPRSREPNLSVSNSSSGRRWKLDHAPAVGDPTHMVEFGTGRRAFAREA